MNPHARSFGVDTLGTRARQDSRFVYIYSLIFRHKDIIVSELLMTGINSFYHDNLVIRHLNIKYSVPLHMRKVKKTSALP